jgi:AcrR family transcriptional regulator
MASITRGSAASAKRQTDTEQRLLDATQRLLEAGESFTEVGVQRIADEAGVARSSFYAHFADKTQLLLALTERLSVIAFDAHDRWNPASDDALPQLVDGFAAIVTHYRRHARILAAVLEVAAYDRDVSRFWDAQLSLFRERAYAWLEAERADGRTSHSLDPGMAARIVVDGGMRIIADQVVNGAAEDDESVARELARIWWHGAYRRP